MISVSEYRKVLKDDESPDEIIQRRIAYLEAFCRSVARIELQAYVKVIKNETA